MTKIKYLILIVLFCASFVVYSQNTSQLADSKDIQQAESLFLELKNWQDNKEWEQFFAHKESHWQEIENILKNIDNPPYLKLRATYLLYQVKDFLGHKDRNTVLGNFLEEVKNISEASPQVLSVLKSSIADLELKSKKNEKRKLSSLYVKLLQKSASIDLLKEEAESFYKNKDMDNFTKLSNAYLDLLEDGPRRRQEIVRLFKKSCCGGFKETCQPYFAEELLEKLDQEPESEKVYDNLGKEDIMYLQGFNLESAYEYTQATQVYEQFLKEFADSKFSSEVAFRLGYIYMYKLKDFDKAKLYFLKAGKPTLVEKHLKILNKDFNLNELSYNEKLFFDSLFGQIQVSPSAQLQIDTLPSRSLVNEKTTIKSISFSPDTGCLVPQGLFLWSGDLGAVKITTNTPEFSTSFSQEGPKIIHLVEQIPGGVLGFDSTLIMNHRVEINLDQQKGSKFSFDADIVPGLPLSFLTFLWRIDKDSEVIVKSDKKNFLHQFKEPGKYSMDFSLFFLGNEVYNRRLLFTVQ